VRSRWVFRNESDVGFYDPATGSWEALPSCPVPGTTIAHIPYWDVYAAVGGAASETAIFDPDTNAWSTVDGGAEVWNTEYEEFDYLTYAASTDRVALVTDRGDFLTFHYVPEAGYCEP
jgi:hypothetical protein